MEKYKSKIEDRLVVLCELAGVLGSGVVESFDEEVVGDENVGAFEVRGGAKREERAPVGFAQSGKPCGDVGSAPINNRREVPPLHSPARKLRVREKTGLLWSG
jgi:hypothetical protein